MTNFAKIEFPIKYLITRGNLTPANYLIESSKTLQLIKIAVANNISLIQIREKHLPVRFVFELVEKAIYLTKKTNAKILVNDRIDIAIASNADGVHLTSNSIPTNIIRQISPKDFIVGVSTHSFEVAAKARNGGADFVTFSPVFPTSSKVKYGKAKGLGKLKEVCSKLKPFPVLALGGIDETNYQSTLLNGASGFAGISFFNDTEKLESI